MLLLLPMVLDLGNGRHGLTRGYRRVHVMLCREGHVDNVKRGYRLYRPTNASELRLRGAA